MWRSKKCVNYFISVITIIHSIQLPSIALHHIHKKNEKRFVEVHLKSFVGPFH